MLVFDIVNRLAKDHRSKKALENKALHGFDITTKPPLNELLDKRNAGQADSIGNVDITISGYSRSIGAEALQKTTTIGLGYGFGKVASTPDATPTSFGAENNDVLLLLWAPFTSFAIGNVIQHYFYDKMLGSKIPKTTVSIPFKDLTSGASSDFRALALDQITTVNANGERSIKPEYEDIAMNEARATGFDVIYSPIHALSCAYHGYQRHGEDLLAGLGWLLFGNLGLAFAQGYAKPLRRKAKSYQVEALRPNEQVFTPQGNFKFNTEPQITLVKQNPKNKASRKKKKPSSPRALSKTKTASASRKKSKARK